MHKTDNSELREDRIFNKVGTCMAHRTFFQ